MFEVAMIFDAEYKLMSLWLNATHATSARHRTQVCCALKLQLLDSVCKSRLTGHLFAGLLCFSLSLPFYFY